MIMLAHQVQVVTVMYSHYCDYTLIWEVDHQYTLHV